MGLGEASLVFLPRVPSVGAQQGACFQNVQRVVAIEGGSAIYGWAFRTWPGCFIEAEQHVVWAKPDGDLVDISPHPADRETAFAPDRKSVFSADGLAERHNFYSNLALGRRRGIVQKLIDVSIEKQKYELRHKRVHDGQVVFDGDLSVLEEYLSKMRALAERLPRKNR